ncbi:MAG: iron-sulfur cluster assembly accessory protein [Deltaproteobacteria bacterium]|nr:iron-sulfur cluster assembly accessory protein [Deltaproteobacteria bacterium]
MSVQAPTNGAHSGLLLTPKAVEMVKEAVARENLDGYGLRVAVVGGGCSGYQYSLDLSKETGPLDTILEQDGVKVFVDMLSLGYLDGTTIDYVETMHGAGFKFENPKAVKTCGCGSSFSP